MAATEEKDVEKTISEDLVVTKYKMAGEIVNSKYLIGKVFSSISSANLNLSQKSACTIISFDCLDS